MGDVDVEKQSLQHDEIDLKHLETLARQYAEAQDSGKADAADMIKATVQAIARSHAAASEARVLATFLNTL